MNLDLTYERLRELLHYDPETGLFTWRVSRGGRKSGTAVSCLDSSGYLRVKIDRVEYRQNRLAWLYVHGVWPVGQIDHEDLCRANNRISNLRQATQSQNLANTRKRSTNKSGFKGVSFCKSSRKWVARCAEKNIGYFKTPEAASAAYCAAAKVHYGEFARAS